MISKKQKKILAFPYSRYDALICDGAAAWFDSCRFAVNGGKYETTL